MPMEKHFFGLSAGETAKQAHRRILQKFFHRHAWPRQDDRLANQ
jgi:hypothetical protein